MGRLLVEEERSITAQRRENKKITDLYEKKSLRHEANVIFNTYYKDQVAALYREIFRVK